MIKKSDDKCSTPFDWEIVEVWPRQASMLAYVVLVRTSEGLVSSRVLV